MSVSFTGINNLKVGRKISQKGVTYLDHSHNVKHELANVTEIKLKCDLTNDSFGRDFDELNNAMKKAKRPFVYNTQNPNEVEIHAIKADIEDDVAPITKNIIKLNGQDIAITKREDLGLYTYLAKLTRQLGNLKTTSPAQKECTDMVNKAIAYNAEDFINNIL